MVSILKYLIVFVKFGVFYLVLSADWEGPKRELIRFGPVGLKLAKSAGSIRLLMSCKNPLRNASCPCIDVIVLFRRVAVIFLPMTQARQTFINQFPLRLLLRFMFFGRKTI